MQTTPMVALTDIWGSNLRDLRFWWKNGL